MALQKQPISINFSEGLETKTDPFQLKAGKFLALTNTVFDVTGRLTKRNGFGNLASLPSGAFSYLTSFNKDLTAIGQTLQAYSRASSSWVNQGFIQPLQLSVLPLIRNNFNQTQTDSALSPNGLVCTVYSESNGSTTSYKYAVADQITGQLIISPTVITSSGNTVAGSPRVFALGNNFVIAFAVTVSATTHIQYIAISSVNLSVTSATDITTSHTPAGTVAWDGVVCNNNLYIAWNGASSSGVKMTYIDQTLTQHNTTNPDASHVATLVSVTADTSSSTAVIWVTYYNSGTSTGYTLAVNQQLSSVLAATQIISSGTILNLTSAATNGVNTVFYETSNAYGYDGSIATNFISKNTITQAGTVGTAAVLARSLGLASKSFIQGNSIYFTGVYASPYQPTYFVLNSAGQIVSRFAYSNGGGYLTSGLPSVQVTGTTASLSYLNKDLVAAVNKATAPASGTQVAGVYSQTGVNLINLNFTTQGLSTAEIGNNLHLAAGLFWMYDGLKPVEHNFLLYPDSIEATWSATGGAIVAKPDGATNTNAYWYQVTYEWTDNQGNPHRSAPSIPIGVTTTGTGTAGSITVNIPTLRLTYKANVKIVVYRWSVAQQTYFQVTSVSAPTLSSTTTDSIAFVDTLADASILGNQIIYTTGGVVEDIAAPAFTSVALFNSRLFGIDAEDENTLWFSKPVISNVPVEMSDLLTYSVPPTQGATGPTGPMRCLAPMDDKLVIFKEGAAEYITGQGPDLTGNNSDFPLSPTFITSTVGCTNQNSIVLTPRGLMFQAATGIWLLTRELGTEFVGSPVQGLTNGQTVLSALNISGTNQIRFTLSSGVTLFYDYFENQWGSFYGIQGLSSTLYQGLHTFINSYGNVLQETPGVYLDGSNPTLIGLTTSWIAPAGIQGYQRAYWLFLLGQYLSPHKLSVGIAYDYNPAIVQQVIIQPDNYSPPFGSDPTIGSSTPFGGPSQVEQWQVNFQRQTCESFQITIQEIYDPTFGVPAGAGLTLSGMEMVVGLKKSYPRNLPASRKVG